MGRVPSRRNLQKYNLVKADELLAVLGKQQGWIRIRIETELKRRFEAILGEIIFVRECEISTSPTEIPKIEPEPQEASSSGTGKRGRRPKYNDEELLKLLTLVAASCGVGLPQRAQLCRLHQDFIKYLGPTDTWEAKMGSV